ncbi:MAG: hypothetical protein EPO40_18785 [Myxococcaceae bacterium]|nr:MAG: hypothetical protein EPO40_18785 [Myxococcaceae bacterium]
MSTEDQSPPVDAAPEVDGETARGSVDESVMSFFEELERLLEQSYQPPCWNLPVLDQLTDKLHPKELLVIGGRPSTGKFSLLLQMIDGSPAQNGQRTLLFSLDSHRTRVARRWLSRLARVETRKIRGALMTQDDLTWLTAAANRLHESRKDIIIDDTPRQTIGYILDRIRKVHERSGVALATIDFVQLLETTPGRETREQEISLIARSLKALAHELEIPIVVVSQLNRMSTGRDTASNIPRKPVTWDLRDSGALEDAADTVLLLHRPELYDKYEDWGIVEINVAKQRHGPKDMVRARFDEATGIFRDEPKEDSPG